MAQSIKLFLQVSIQRSNMHTTINAESTCRIARGDLLRICKQGLCRGESLRYEGQRSDDGAAVLRRRHRQVLQLQFRTTQRVVRGEIGNHRDTSVRNVIVLVCEWNRAHEHCGSRRILQRGCSKSQDIIGRSRHRTTTEAAECRREQKLGDGEGGVLAGIQFDLE